MEGKTISHFRILSKIAQGGMGVKILRADESYYSSLAEWMRISLEKERETAPAKEAPAKPAAPAPPREPMVTYRVRVRAARGPAGS